MRHAAIEFAKRVNLRHQEGQKWDAIFCTDMLNLAEFKGLVSSSISDLPTLIYFHENQLGYPVRKKEQRDTHFAFTNFIAAAAADQVWFNSAFNKDQFFTKLRDWFGHLPDFSDNSQIDALEIKSKVQHPGISFSSIDLNHSPSDGPPILLWAARWEHDKNPELFFDALRILIERKQQFRVSVIGQQFRTQPPCFEQAKHWLGERIVRWGFQDSRATYWNTIAESDIYVSTANHEYFGLSAVEAITHGLIPCLPNGLSYPELLAIENNPERKRFLYAKHSNETENAMANRDAMANNNSISLADSLEQLLIQSRDTAAKLRNDVSALREEMKQKFHWSVRAKEMDNAIGGLIA